METRKFIVKCNSKLTTLFYILVIHISKHYYRDTKVTKTAIILGVLEKRTKSTAREEVEFCSDGRKFLIWPI